MIRTISPEPLRRRLLPLMLSTGRLARAAAWLAMLATALGAVGTVRPAWAQSGIRSLASLEQEVRFQAPSFRLEAMGGLGLAVRDEYNEVNLWDYAGLPLGLAADRDSTNLDVWFDQNGRNFDQRSNSIDYEVDHRSTTRIAGEGVVRSGTLAVGADIGSFAFRHGTPFGDEEHLTNNGSQPAFVPVMTAKLAGPIHWGVRGIWARETFQRQVWGDEVEDGKVKARTTGTQHAPPNLFFPQDIKVPTYGLGASLGYFQGAKGEGGLYFDYRNEEVRTSLETVRSVYESTEPRDIFGYGIAAVVRPAKRTEVGIQAGREHFKSTEDYRFSLSGGSVDPAFNGRGERLLRGSRTDYFGLRVQSDVMEDLTLGGAYRVSYHRDQTQAAEGHPSDFNEFVRNRVSADTIQAPAFVEDQLKESRGIEYGLGASLRVLKDRGTVGGEYRHFRDALNGDDILTRAIGWEVRAGGEYLISSHWTGRAGYRHHFEDQDDETPRNELVADRATFGVEYGGWKAWTLEAYGYHEWWRTDYPDPGELGGPGAGLGLTARKVF